MTLAILMLWTACSLSLIAACGSGNGDSAPIQSSGDAAADHSELPKSVHRAILKDDEDTVLEFIEDGGDPNSVFPETGASGVHIAAMVRDSRCLKLLLEHGANPDQKDEGGSAPIVYALLNNRTENLVCLLEAGASQANVGLNGMSALAAAANLDRPECAEVLLDHGANPLESAGPFGTPLHMASGSMLEDSSEMMSLFLRYLPPDARMDQTDSHGWTPLARAMMFYSPKAAKLLLNAGADPRNCVSKDESVVHMAARCDDVELLQRILESGGVVDAPDRNGQTALHEVAENGNAELAELLLNNHADVNTQDDWGDTPLHLAAERSDDEEEKQRTIECVKLLLKHGADRTIKNNDGQTPLDVAYWLDVEMLLKDDGEG
ncbi:MAG: ankyrin repeat domain-containing protein [Planctomycetes bacterium]|nr:ankyrin repeat domain-containing protein [Planctomycetota bacterium]